MCGFAGILEPTVRTAPDALSAIAGAMAARLRHRGPDADGVWADGRGGFAVGHRRLSIRDLTDAGAQPMTSEDGRYTIAYNGEAYGIDPLRRDLEGRGMVFRGLSDTEVVLKACARLGVDAALERLNGMFAFALWDARGRRLWLVRDRLGIKPLYWGRADDGAILFASELTAFAAHPAWQPSVDTQALGAFMALSYVPAPLSIWRQARKLEPGTLVMIAEGKEPRVQKYWDLASVATAQTDITDAADAAVQIEEALEGAVAKRLVSDVPLGVFLSGGIDSSLIAALAARQGPTRTFTIGFEDLKLDESKHAQAIAAHLGTDHADLLVTGADALASAPGIADIYDEPFADSSQIPTLLLSRFARGSVTVALSGDGGDEVFAGYNRHLWAHRHWPFQARTPGFAKAIAAAVLRAWPGAGEQRRKLAASLECDDLDGAYDAFITQAMPGADAVPGAQPMPRRPAPAGLGPLGAFQFLDTAGYLPGDVLTKVDRASMSVGLEVRVPMLDHELLTLAWRLAPELRIQGGRTKAVLRAVAARHLPPALFEGRPKAGFAVPLAAWLRGPLRDWADDLLSETALKRSGLLDGAVVSGWWRSHRTGQRDLHHALWNVLMFQSWLAGAGRVPE